MPQATPSETKNVKNKRKKALSLTQKLALFHQTYPNGSIKTQQIESHDSIFYKAIVTPDVKFPIRFFNGHCQAGLISLYSVKQPSIVKRAEKQAVEKAFYFMGIGLDKN